MKQTFIFCCALLLLTGCQTGKATFSFRPASAVAVLVAGGQAAPATSAPAATPAAPVPVRFVSRAAVPRRVPLRRLVPLRQLVPSLASASAATAGRTSAAMKNRFRRRPQQPQLEHTAAFVLGVALVAGGITTGILLGGWLGLGVGALVVLLGYYFLGVGIGGKHAWLEVFQEFFNM